MPDTPRMFALAEQVMDLSRNAIVMNLRFMDMAVFRLRPEPADTTLATDGRYLFYGPEHVLRRYMRDEALPARDYLHALLHCVFRHPYIDTLVDRRLWNLATDIAVEAVINSLELPRFEAGRELDQRPILDALTDRLGLNGRPRLTAALKFLSGTMFGIYLLENLLKDVTDPVYLALRPHMPTLAVCGIWLLATMLLGNVVVGLLKLIPGVKKYI